MKRRDLLKSLRKIAKDAGVEYSESEGGRHTVVRVGNEQTVVPRHNEINEKTAKSIIQQAKGEK